MKQKYTQTILIIAAAVIFYALINMSYAVIGK
ncbi:hypothetical protein Psfp_00657 [Pelotomaculum sp. FP]|nr:hypothetical protein Psfp_00657 [Pelotomaculum sp. FP]